MKKCLLLFALIIPSAFAQTTLNPGTYNFPPGTTIIVPTPTPTPTPTPIPTPTPTPIPTPTPTPIPTPTPAPTPSPDGTIVLNNSGGSIIDATGGAWTCSGGIVDLNGAPAGYSSNVTEIVYIAGSVCQQNNLGGWWKWTGSAWTSSPNPVPTPTPSPTPTPLVSNGFQLFGLVSDLPNANITGAYVGHPYNAINPPASDMLYAMVTTNIATFNWTAIDNLMAFCRANNTKFIWYCGYLAWAQGQNFPANFGWTGSKVVTLFTNLMSQAAARYPDLAAYCYFNYNNEGLVNSGSSGTWQDAFGGAGSTGVDWIINTGKIVRQYFPTAKIGVNDYRWEADETIHNGPAIATRLPQALTEIPYLISANVLDWIGMEGYSLECQTSAGLTSALNKVGALGVKVIYTEFTPGGYYWFDSQGSATDAAQNADATWADGKASWQGTSASNQTAAWKRLVPLLSTNQYCLGICGPWTSFQGGYIFDGSPPTDRPAMAWVKNYVPTVLHP